MKTGIIAAIVLVVVALYFVFGSDMLAPANSDAVATSEDSSREARTRPSKKSTSAQEEGASEPGTRESDKVPAGTTTTRTGDDAVDEGQAAATPGSSSNVTRTPGAPTQFTRHDGVVIRDHRIGAPKPDLHAYTVIPPEASKVKGVTLIEVRKALRSPVQECIDSHGQSAADDGELQLLLLTSIASENLTVDKASIKITGLASEADLQSCLEQAVVGHQQRVDGAEDVNIHRMVFKYNL